MCNILQHRTYHITPIGVSNWSHSPAHGLSVIPQSLNHIALTSNQINSLFRSFLNLNVGLQVLDSTSISLSLNFKCLVPLWLGTRCQFFCTFNWTCAALYLSLLRFLKLIKSMLIKSLFFG